MAAVPVAASSSTAIAQPSAILLQAASKSAPSSLSDLRVKRSTSHGVSTSSTMPGAWCTWAKASTSACTVNAGVWLKVRGDGKRERSCSFQRAPDFLKGESIFPRPTTKRTGFGLRAKRKSSGGGNAIQEDEDVKGDIDDDTRLGLNEISTEALKAMLSEDDNVVADLREKVEYIENYLLHEDQADAAKFMLVIKGMLDHEAACRDGFLVGVNNVSNKRDVILENAELKGSYKKAFDKIFSVIEDSGWVLKQAGADLGGVEMVDDELMPPVLNTQY